MKKTQKKTVRSRKKKRKTSSKIAYKVSLAISPFAADSISLLKGRELRSLGRNGELEDHGFKIDDQDHRMNRYLSILLGEAIYAAEAFAEENGYLPWQPRITIGKGKDIRLTAPRNWEKLAEAELIEKVLAAASAAP